MGHKRLKNCSQVNYVMVNIKFIISVIAFLSHFSINFGGTVSVALSKEDWAKNNVKVVGFIGYNSICFEFQVAYWIRSYDNETGLSSLMMDNEVERQVYYVLYGASRTVANYARFMVKRKLAGVWAFTIDKDDFKGQCKLEKDTFADFKSVNGVTFHFPPTYQAKYPLLRTINESIFVALDEEFQLMQTNKGTASNFIRTSNFIGIIIVVIGFLCL